MSLSLNCLILGDDPERMFTVDIPKTENVSILKEIIREKNSCHFGDVAASDLDLWKVCLPVDNLDTILSLKLEGYTKLSPPTKKLSKFFDEADDEGLHIIAKGPPALENEAPLTSLPDLLKDRLQFNAKLSVTPPSTLGYPDTFSKIQATDTQKIIWSRPPDAEATIPVTLYHPIFRQFIDDCKNHQPIDSDNKLVRELTTEMSNFFPNKRFRAAKLRDILGDNEIPVTTPIISSKGHFFDPDGAIESNNCLTAIIEVKEEIGSASAEPYAQAILYYAHSNWKASEEYPTFNFPCFIINVFGPQISFSGAVWGGRPHFQVLTPSMPLFCHYTDTEMRKSLARCFGAWQKAILSLEKCYDALENPTLLETLNPRFPDPRTYRCLETVTTVSFRYLHQIDEKKLLFVGEADHGERICIKFVHRYSRAVHEKCEAMGVAPKLRGFEDIGAGWKMVIMDALDEEYKPFDKNIRPVETHKEIGERLVELHQANFVHGDVRDANIMVRKDGKPGFMLVDFDWSGIIGQARYPSNVNNVDFWRPKDVSDGLLIKSDHDMAMLDTMFC